MRAEVKKEVRVSITLTEAEVHTLMSIVQNPQEDNEPADITNFRFQLFDTLRQALDSVYSDTNEHAT